MQGLAASELAQGQRRAFETPPMAAIPRLFLDGRLTYSAWRSISRERGGMADERCPQEGGETDIGSRLWGYPGLRGFQAHLKS